LSPKKNSSPKHTGSYENPASRSVIEVGVVYVLLA
jgi:hypothetical protein